MEKKPKLSAIFIQKPKLSWPQFHTLWLKAISINFTLTFGNSIIWRELCPFYTWVHNSNQKVNNKKKQLWTKMSSKVYSKNLLIAWTWCQHIPTIQSIDFQLCSLLWAALWGELQCCLCRNNRIVQPNL